MDNGLFMFHANSGLMGVIVTHVDDILWAGPSLLETGVIDRLKSLLNISSEQSSAFCYIGISMEQAGDSTIRISQDNYIVSMEPVVISRERLQQKNSALTKHERSQLCSVMGKINWVSGISRPDIGFSAGQISLSANHAMVSDLIAANKLINHVKNGASGVLLREVLSRGHF